jgi:Baseplate J-like protein
MQPSKYVAEVKSILASIDEPDKDSQEQRTPDASDTSQPITEVDVYIEEDRITLIPKKPAQEEGIESTPTASPHISDMPTVPLAPLTPPKRYVHVNWWSVLAVALLLILAGEHTIPLVWPLVDNYFHPKATVTLFPTQKQVRYQYTFLIVTGTADQSRQQIPSRIISFTSPTRTETIKTTGIGYTPAIQATGIVSFYNEAPYSQTIDAGTVITGSDGIQIVTDQTISINAGNPPYSYGSAEAPAHSLKAGSIGNISVLDINGLCCLAGIYAKNIYSFTDGADPKPYPILSNADVKREAYSLAGILHPLATEGIQSQIKLSEQLLQPISCNVNSSSNPKVRERATTASISVSETCNAQVYDYSILQSLTRSAFLKDAQSQAGSNYIERGNLSIATQKTTLLEKSHSTYQLEVSAAGMLIFHLSASKLQRLKMQIAGKRIAEAQRELLQLAGVQGVYIKPSSQNDTSLPTDPGQIQIQVMTGS